MERKKRNIEVKEKRREEGCEKIMGSKDGA
jgi:hypothetical protein